MLATVDWFASEQMWREGIDNIAPEQVAEAVGISTEQALVCLRHLGCIEDDRDDESDLKREGVGG